MANQLIEVVIPEGRSDAISELLHDITIIDSWHGKFDDNRAGVYLLVDSGQVETILDILETFLEPLPGARAMLLPLDAMVPRPEPPASDKSSEQKEEKEEQQGGSPVRISRQELYNDVAAGTTLSWHYAAMVALSAVIAAIGLVRNDMAIIIGAMVLAPLLLPNVAFALANTLGDISLGRDAFITAVTGITLAVFISTVSGFAFPVDPSVPAIAARIQLHWSDLLLALASGSAGVLALTGGRGALSLVGVMVAVALMPPLVTAGLMLGSGYYPQALSALDLAFANIICINLAGVITFNIQGIRPSTWWEKNRAKQASLRVTVILLILFVLLALIIVNRNMG
jgi:uncharacterized hydrophobic protein (TIGR00341 family)